MKPPVPFLAALFAFHFSILGAPPWKEILGPPQGSLPVAAGFNVTWRTNFHIPPDHMAVEPIMGDNPKGAPYAAGWRGSQIVTAINGQSPDLTGRAFLVWFIRQFEPGDRVTRMMITVS